MKDETKFFMCERKKRFSAKKHAEARLKSIRKKGIIVPPDAHVYLCPVCSGYHLGHAPNPLTVKELENVRKNDQTKPQ